MTAPAPALFEMTGTDGLAHLVTEDAITAGRPTGHYLPVCGSPILAASLTTPKRGYCRPCRHGRAGR